MRQFTILLSFLLSGLAAGNAIAADTRLRELSLHRFQAEALKQVGNVHQTLILNKASRKAEGLTRNYWPVRLNLSEEQMVKLSGSEISVKITGVNFETGEGQLEGVIL